MAINWQRTVMRLYGAREQAVTVTAIEDVLPWYRRVHFSAPEFMRDLELFPTIWVRLWVPDLDDPDKWRQRGYTLVDPNPEAGTFALEFVMHEAVGAAAQWASTAKPGDVTEIAFTPAKIAPEPGIEHFVIAGDASALPAINSLLDFAPSSAQVHLVFQDGHKDAAQLPLRSHPNLHLTLVSTVDEQIDALRTLDFTLDSSYAWGAGERRAVTAMRQVFRGEWQLPKDRQHTQYYWIEGKAFG